MCYTSGLALRFAVKTAYCYDCQSMCHWNIVFQIAHTCFCRKYFSCIFKQASIKLFRHFTTSLVRNINVFLKKYNINKLLVFPEINPSGSLLRDILLPLCSERSAFFFIFFSLRKYSPKNRSPESIENNSFLKPPPNSRRSIKKRCYQDTFENLQFFQTKVDDWLKGFMCAVYIYVEIRD